MSRFRSISLTALAIIAVLCAYALTRPDTFRVERSVMIRASPENLFPLISDFRQFVRWSPYESRDPAMQRHFSPVSSGHGASYRWAGNDAVGEGRLEIIHSAPPTRVLMQLDFSRPVEAHNTIELSLSPLDGQTRVTWAMEGPLPFTAKLMSIFFSMDAMVGHDFETGLASLQKLADSLTPPAKDTP